MSRQITIKDLSTAVVYFNTLLLEKIDMKSFQNNLTTIHTFLHDQAMSKSCPLPLLENIFTILVSKYFQIFTQNYKIITEQYLQNQFTSVIKVLFEEHMDKGKLSKNIYALCLAANINKLKQEISQSPKNNDTTITLLNFTLSLLAEIIKRNDFKIKEFYPKIVSLCSNALRKQNFSLKAFELVLQITKVLISVNECLNKSSWDDLIFEQESHKRLIEDIEHLIQRYTTLEIPFRVKLKSFSQFLLNYHRPSQYNSQHQFLSLQGYLPGQDANVSNLKMKLFSSIVLFAQVNSIPIDLQFYTFLQKETIRQSYKQHFISTCSRLLKVEVNMELKKQQLSKLNYLVGQVELTEEDGDEASSLFRKLVTHMFHIRKSHCLITIPNHACTIPLQLLLPTHTRQNYTTKHIDVEYGKEFRRMLTEIIPFYELEPQLVETIQQLFSSITDSSRLCLLRTLSDSLVESEYHLDMSLTKLYSYLSLLLSIRFVISTAPMSFEWYNIAYCIYETLASKSQSVKSLRASYIEEELLISTTIQIISCTYRYLKRYYLSHPTIANRVKLTQSTILLTEKILNSLVEESYLIRLITTDSLLTFAEDRTLAQSLQNIHAALIHRNKNNLQLILNILSITSLNSAQYEELAQFYMNHQSSQMILRVLLPKISIERCRMCLLTVQKWWLLMSKEVVEYLNGKEMKTNDQKSQHFYVKDGENVTIKNALGVIILEMAQKWKFYLRSQKKEVIVDIMLELSKTNPKMIFFRSFFSTIAKQLIVIVKQCLGYQPETITITCRKKKTSGKQQKSAILPKKVEFYDRLRLKIYKLFTNLPNDSYLILEKEVKESLRSIIEPQQDEVKRDYLFNGNTDLKDQYQLAKQVLLLLQ